MFYKATEYGDGDWQTAAGVRKVIHESPTLTGVSDPENWTAATSIESFAFKRGLTRVAEFVADDPAATARIEALRQAYRDATHAFCQLAGRTVVDKLEDVDYQACAVAAYTANPVAAGMIADTLLYCLTSLRAYDGADAWDRI